MIISFNFLRTPQAFFEEKGRLKKTTEWLRKSNAVCEKAGLPLLTDESAQDVAGMTTKELRGVRKTPTTVDLIELNEKRFVVQGKAPPKWIDFGESHGRALRSEVVKPTFCFGGKTQIYVYKEDRAMVAEEFAFSLGYGVESVRDLVLQASQGLSEQEVRDLFRDGMALPHMCLVLAAVLLAMPNVFKKKD